MKMALDEEANRRSFVQLELNNATQDLTVLRTQEKELKAEYNRVMDEKRQAQDTLSRKIK